MTNNSETQARPALVDTALLAAACLVLLASIVAYYYFEGVTLVLRVIGILAGFGIGAALMYQTRQGQVIWQFILGSRVEIRKVIWPTRKELITYTWVGIVFVSVFAAIVGLFDLVFTRLVLQVLG